MNPFTAAIAEIDQRIANLREGKAVLLKLAKADGPIASPTSRVMKPTGTAALVVDVLKEGPATIKQLTKACKVKEAAVRRALTELGGRVGVVERSWPRQYGIK